jgi:hypothetical protein
MMRLLTDVSAAYTGIFVVGVAIVLVTICVSLLRVSRILGRAQERLTDVERYTQPRS